MPPHVDVDSFQDDLCCPSRPGPLAPSDARDDAKLSHQSSPLFRDTCDDGVLGHPPSTPSSSCGLEPCQSDPDFSALPAPPPPNPRTPPPPPVSRITAIIGPESAYVRSTEEVLDGHAGAARATAKAVATSATKEGAINAVKSVSNGVKTGLINAVKKEPAKGEAAVARQRPLQPKQTPQVNAFPSGRDQKKVARPKTLLRVSRRAGRKGLRAVRSLPRKLATTAGSMRTPFRRRNVV
ncbi:hypothetical protein ACHAWF_008631 [Thalassiosira exigua]